MKMKNLKYFISLFVSLSILISCNEDDRFDYLDNVAAPSNISALVSITQDNTGLVTIIPNGIGAVSFDIDFGDGTEEQTGVNPGEEVQHTYTEGNYELKIAGSSVNGKTTIATQPLVVSFNPPQNLEVIIENDAAVSKQVNVTATADYAVSFDVYFGEDTNATPVSGNIGETVSYIYQNAGTYTIRVVAKGGAIETTEYTEEFTVTEILQPIVSAPRPPSRADQDVISIFSGAYTDLAGTDYFPDWGQGGQGSSWSSFDLNGDAMLQYINLSYQGIQFGSAVDVTAMEFLHLDVWTAGGISTIETSLISVSNGEQPVVSNLTAGEWTSIDIPISAYTDQGLTVADIHQLKFVGDPWAAGTVFIDNIYFYKSPEPASGLEGVWKMAPEAGAFKVGPGPGTGDYFANSLEDVTTRACYFDDEYVFGLDGSFSNVLQSETWLEGWQGASPDQCGTPVAPHDGSGSSTFVYDEGAGTVTLNGAGVYLGLPKVVNGGELPNVPVPSSITYDITLSDNNNRMELIIDIGGAFWTFQLVREVPVIAGTWMLAPEAGAFKVGPGPGTGDYFANSLDDVTTRSCFFDDQYVFGSDGSFMNVLQSETWLEGWQGVSPDQCGTPVAPHDGQGFATYSYDEVAGTITLNGTGAYLGLPKAVNGGELPNVAVPSSIIYDITLSDNNNRMEVIIDVGGAFWTYQLVR